MTKATRILVIDDSSEDQMLFRMLLKRLNRQGQNIEMVEATGAESALIWLKSGQCDLIVIDQNMPCIDGTQTLKMIRERKYAEGVPAISYSNCNQRALKEQSPEFCFSDYQTKYMEPKDLLNLIEKYVYSSR